MAVVVITGCSSGFGLVTALAFARRGDRVYATMRTTGRSHDLVEAAEAEGVDVCVLELDVTNDASVEQAIAHVLDAEGRIDVLVNNAGTGHFGSVELLPDELMRSTFETNLFGLGRVLRAVLPTMRSQRSGVIVNMSSMAGQLPAPGIFWSYTASKHGVSVLSDSLAMELAPFGIRVICIEPGFFRTDIVAKASRPSEDDSPYRTLESAVVAFYENWSAQGPDPQLVADAIVEAVDRDDGRVHVLVGDDAELFVSQYRSRTEAELRSMFEQLLGLGDSAAPEVTG